MKIFNNSHSYKDLIKDLNSDNPPPPEVFARLFRSSFRSSYKTAFYSLILCVAFAIYFAVSHERSSSAVSASLALMFLSVCLPAYRNDKKIIEDMIQKYEQ